MFSSPSRESVGSLEGGAANAEVELHRAGGTVIFSTTAFYIKHRGVKATHAGEVLRDLWPRRLLPGERERDRDLERERLWDDLERLLDLKGGRRKACNDKEPGAGPLQS